MIKLIIETISLISSIGAFVTSLISLKILVLNRK